jgi:hypothetical protein
MPDTRASVAAREPLETQRQSPVATLNFEQPEPAVDSESTEEAEHEVEYEDEGDEGDEGD